MIAAIRTIAAGLALGMVSSAQAQAPLMPARDAVERSIASPASPLPEAWIEMNVCGAGEDGSRGYLNSKENYRDRGSLNVELTAPVRAALAARYGGDPIDVLFAERIRVYGAVRQVRISVFRQSDGVTVGSYFQTQLRLASADRLEVVARTADLSDDAACGPLAT
ncbi:hypothetical protein ACWCOP_05335 [Maricaulaceae bacterium MS644]